MSHCAAARVAQLRAFTPMLLAALVTVCGEEIVDYDALYLSITAEASPSGTIAHLDLALRNVPGAAAVRLPASANDADLAFQLPPGHNLVSKPYRVKIQQKSGAAKLQLRVHGLADNKTVLAAWSGVVDTGQKGDVAIVLVTLEKAAKCDQDGDGVPNCATPGCCKDPKNEASDCDDDPTPDKDGKKKGAASSPFNFEDPCLQCGNGIDEDCNGGDVACVDSDGDGVPDCQEGKCGAGAEKDKDVKPGGQELCDGKDNDCNGQTDELPYKSFAGTELTGIKKGDACPDAKGTCAGGTVECAPGQDGKSTALRCTTLSKAVTEVCDNKLDDNCNGAVDEGCALKSTDADGDNIPDAEEDKACSFYGPFAKFHAEVYPGAKEPCCKVGLKPESCDWNCDGKITACDPNDKDGDGFKTPADCNDNDPLIYPGAPDKCGDKVAQGCVGGDTVCNPATDKDGDGWPATCKPGQQCDCNDNDKNVNPEAKESCNGIDDNCDGVVDDGNPEGNDEPCGNKNGECGKGKDGKYGQFTGFTVCKHFPKNAGKAPDELDCLKKKYDDKQGICVGCYGDTRPAAEKCDYLDNDCDGKNDQTFSHKDATGATLPVGVACKGVGICGKGVVECTKDLSKAVCSTNPDGSKSEAEGKEACDNEDDNCNGLTDENLTALTEPGNTCSKVGVCGGSATSSIQTVCVTGYWVCDYAAVPNIEFSKGAACKPGASGCQCDKLGQNCKTLVESSCDGLDNDCDSKTDDDFEFDDLGKKVKVNQGCGTGACKDGTVVCDKNDKSKLVCDKSAKFTAKEECNGIDDDCDGKTDELSDASMAVEFSPCLLQGGVCNKDNVSATCPAAKWVCDYSKTSGYESGKELTCDAKDNDCDGQTDEDFDFTDFNNIAKKITQPCGTGNCKGGKVVCSADNKSITCDTLVNKKSVGPAEPQCNGQDDDCDGKTDEDWPYLQENAKQIAWGDTCDGVGVCGQGIVQCVPGKTDASICSTDLLGTNPGDKPEICNDLDDDCNTITDDKCDEDGDGWCDVALQTVGTPKVCKNGGGDCQPKNKDVNPGAKEICDTNFATGIGVDNDCDGKTDEDFQWVQKNAADNTEAKLSINAACGMGACAGGKVVCADKAAATCDSLNKKKAEACNDIDDDCNGITDEGCDDDKDGWCDVALAVSGKPKVCPMGAGDCNDGDNAVHPTAKEVCNDVDDDCDGQTDEGCDDDKDGFCDAGMTVVLVGGKAPKACPKNSDPNVKDCNDDAPNVFPGALEKCNDIDDDCDGKIDEACDDDKDGYCDANMVIEFGPGGAAPASCPKTTPTAKDCNDDVKEINPSAPEVCDDIDNNCSGVKDEGCDDDKDGYCDANMVFVKATPACSKTKGPGDLDCDDANNAINPGAAEKCNNLDDNCKDSVDEGCDDDGDGYCDANMTLVGTPNVCPKGGGDCNDDVKQINPGVAKETCDNIDNNCKDGIDEGCDDDKDSYCDIDFVVLGQPLACTKGGGDCNDTNKNVNPGMTEVCNDVDDNCKDGVDEGCDDDKDGYCDAKMTVAKDSPLSCPKSKAGAGDDCDDNVKAINPAASEICDDKDQNCKGGVDEGCDDDGDGYCDANMTVVGVPKVCPNSAADTGDDCDDTNKSVNPGATEVCNDIDDNCKAGKDESCDDDGDDYCDAKMTVAKNNPASCPKSKIGTGDDCDDNVKAINPGAIEICDNKDQNCKLGADDGCDDDKDGYCDANMQVVGTPTICSQSAKDTGDDCDDTNAKMNPGMTEVCNGIDDNCKSVGGVAIDEGFTYNESGQMALGAACGLGICTGGKVECAADGSKAVCSTVDGSAKKKTAETCNGKDDNCDGTADEGFTYAEDSKTLKLTDSCGLGECTGGKVECASDGSKAVCSTVDGSQKKKTSENCNSKDDDCDGATDEGMSYAEGGKDLPIGASCGLGECAGGTVYCKTTSLASCTTLDKAGDIKKANEKCDTKDNDCDGQTDEDILFADTQCKKVGVCAAGAPPGCTTGCITFTCVVGVENCNYSNVPFYSTSDPAGSSDSKDNDCDGQTDNGP